MSIIGIDVGEKRVGVALTDELDITVQPFGVFPPEAAIEAVSKLCTERKITTIIIGMPYNSQGEEGFAAQKIKKFRAQLEPKLLQNKWQGDIIYFDEAFTTEKAEEWLREAGLKGKKRREVVDKLAAVAILENYLSER